jgi:hypothetical protein
MKNFEKLADNAITESPELPLTKGICSYRCFWYPVQCSQKKTISVLVEKLAK